MSLFPKKRRRLQGHIPHNPQSWVLTGILLPIGLIFFYIQLYPCDQLVTLRLPKGYRTNIIEIQESQTQVLCLGKGRGWCCFGCTTRIQYQDYFIHPEVIPVVFKPLFYQKYSNQEIPHIVIKADKNSSMGWIHDIKRGLRSLGPCQISFIQEPLSP